MVDVACGKTDVSRDRNRVIDLESFVLVTDLSGRGGIVFVLGFDIGYIAAGADQAAPAAK